MSGGSKRRCLYLAIGMVEIYVLVSFTKYVINPHHSSIDVTHASLAEFNRISTTTINALHYNLVLHIDLQNRNRYFNVYYDRILVMAYYQNQRFITKNFANVVYQEKNETTHLTLALKGQQDMDNTLGVVEELAHQECLNSDVEQKPEQCIYDDNGDERNKNFRSSSEYDILVRIFLQTTAIPNPGLLIRMNWIGNSLLTCNLKRVPVTTTKFNPSSFTSARCTTDFYRVFHPPGSG